MATREEIHLPSPAKKCRIEGGIPGDVGKPQQLVERHWVKLEQSEESQPKKLLKVMQWNMLADGILYYIAPVEL